MAEAAAGAPATAGDNEQAIEAVSVTRRYLRGKFTAVDDISLDVPEGQVVAFVGPSGCGKTTMLRMIAGLEDPSEGDIFCFGKPVLGPGPDRVLGDVHDLKALSHGKPYRLLAEPENEVDVPLLGELPDGAATDEDTSLDGYTRGLDHVGDRLDVLPESTGGAIGSDAEPRAGDLP